VSTARGFTDRRIAMISMFRPWGNLETSILANHSACNLLARNMQLLFLNSRFGPACSWPGQASRRQTPFAFFPVPYCGVVPWVKDYITPLANSPSRSMQSVISVTHVPCRATGVPAAAFSPSPRPSRAVYPSCFPVDLFLLVVASQLHNSVQVGVLT
jgi:hypothetical protein